MATTAGNSNSPRLGVPITIRSAANSSSCGREIPTAKTMKTENAAWHRLLDALMIGPTRSNYSLTNRQFRRCPSRSTEIRIFCFLDSPWRSGRDDVWRRRILLQSDILAEIILSRIIGFEGVRDSVLLPTTRETFFQKRHHKTPRVFRRFFPVASRHSVVQPAMRRVATETHVISLLHLFEAVAEPGYVI